MNARNQGRGRQTRKERPFKERQQDNPNEPTRNGNLRNDSRIDLTKNRRAREGKGEELTGRPRDGRNYDNSARVTVADGNKDRNKNDRLRRNEKERERNNTLIQNRDNRDGHRESLKGIQISSWGI